MASDNDRLERAVRRLKLVEAGESYRDVYKSASYYTARSKWRDDVSLLINSITIHEQIDDLQSQGVQQPKR